MRHSVLLCALCTYRVPMMASCWAVGFPPRGPLVRTDDWSYDCLRKTQQLNATDYSRATAISGSAGYVAFGRHRGVRPGSRAGPTVILVDRKSRRSAASTVELYRCCSFCWPLCASGRSCRMFLLPYGPAAPEGCMIFQTAYRCP